MSAVIQGRKRLSIGNIPLKWPLMLSPMASYTNLPFRAAIRSLGGLSVATTDLVNARSLLEMNPKGIKMVLTSSYDRPLGVQLFGGNPLELRDAARFLEDLGIDFIDINMGCPSPKVNAGGAGAALMKDEELTEDLIEAVVGAVSLPVTVKMRLGWDDRNINAHIIAPRLEAMGVAAVAVHGRTREQGYAGQVNLEGIRAVAETVKRIPVIGNGDVHSPEDAERMLRVIGCDAVMVGRATLSDPFFFRRTAHYLDTGTHQTAPSLEERVRHMHRHFSLSVCYLGEWEAALHFRKMLPHYAEHFPHGRGHGPKEWSRRSVQLESVDDYCQLCSELLPEELNTAYREKASLKNLLLDNRSP